MSKPSVVVLMGTMSSGKTFFGKKLSDHLSWPLHDGDSDHPPANKEKMRAGIPLDDNDRRPWLEIIGQRIKQANQHGRPTIIICPAHKRAYRDILRQQGGPFQLVHLWAPKPVLQHRARTRQHEYMNPNLVDSQLAILETPGDDEQAISINTDGPANHVLQELLDVLCQQGICAPATLAA